MPNPHTHWRSPRAHLGADVPAILRLPNGRQHRGNLETLSLSGGLLNLSDMLEQGSHPKLLFVTSTGPVLGAVEMLRPVSTTQQPFRFVAVEGVDQRRLRATVQTHSQTAPDAWVEKYRAAVRAGVPKQRNFFRIAMGSLGLLTLLGSVIYLLSAHLLK